MSDLEQEEMVWRITRQYVAEVRAGLQPQLQSYLARYPQHASEIADFISYYQEFEVHLQDENGFVYISSSSSGENVLASALQQFHASSAPVESLLVTGSGPLTLAQELDLSEDLLLLLERRLLLEETLPVCLVEKLAFVLHQTEFAVRTYLRRAPASEKYQVRGAHVRFVAEEPGLYAQSSSRPRRSFLQALEESTLATLEQKQRWRVIIECDQGDKNAKNSLS
jgi:hypothetical protein